MNDAPANDVATYSVGDYVYVGRGGQTRLARIESAHSLRSNGGPLWLVRLRMKTAWSSGSVHYPVQRALSAVEVARNRKLGLIPPAGERL